MCICCSLPSYSSWITSIDSWELEAICATLSTPSGKNQDRAMLLLKHSNYYKHGRHWQLHRGGKWVQMECCHYLQVWDQAQSVISQQRLCLVYNKCAMFYMPLLIFPRSTLTSRSKDNWQFMTPLFHLMSQRGGFQATAWPWPRHTSVRVLTYAHANTHTPDILLIS